MIKAQIPISILQDTFDHIIIKHNFHDEPLPSCSKIETSLNNLLKKFKDFGLIELAKNRDFLFDTPPTDSSSFNLKTWCSSRFALFRALNTYSKNEVKGKKLYCTISHCKTISIAAAIFVPKDNPVDGIGIDIEEAERKISKKVFQKVRNPNIEKSNHDLLGQWLSKEAIFKSIQKNEKLSLKNIPLQIIQMQSNIEETFSKFTPSQESFCRLKTLQLKQSKKKWRYGTALNFNY